ncbi:MAG: hypothetical protein NVSMB57_01850 [Actinomycetota bacterium]
MPTTRRAFLFALALLLIALPASASGIALSTNALTFSKLPAEQYVPLQAIVRFEQGTSPARRTRALQEGGATLIRSLLLPDFALVSLNGDPDTALTRLRRVNALTSVQPNLRLMVQGTANDPCNAITPRSDCPATAWHLAATAAFAGWQRFPGAFFSPSHPKSSLPARVKIAVIDTPVMRNNTDFKNGYSSDDLVYGGQLDLASAAEFPNPVAAEGGTYSYHGTYVASIAAASANNAYGSAGIAYSADVLPLPAVHGSDGRADAASVGDAIVFAYSKGARVITLALGIKANDQKSLAYVNEAIQRVSASPNPPLIVAAAGNNTGNDPFYPAWFDNVMAVGGTDQRDRRAPCANFSSKVSVAAPAVGVQGLSDSAYMTAPACGTSAATPQVSGLAALLFQQDPSRTPADVRSIIEQSADHLGPAGRNDEFGFGRINIDRALSFGLGTPTTTDVLATPISGNGGGTSRITARVNAPATIVAASAYIDRQPSSPSDVGHEMSAQDGAFDSSAENVALSLTPGLLTPGAHRVYVRGKDANNAWGPLGSGVLYVDASPPVIYNVQATNAIRPVDAGPVITFTVFDDYSLTIGYDVEVVSSLDRSKAVWSSGLVTAPAGDQRIQWIPRSSDLPGVYSIRITAHDEAGNRSSTSVSTVIV